MDFTAIEAKLKAMGLDLPARLAEFASHINSTAVLAALIGGWVVGWIWYALVGSVWKESVGTGKVGEYTPRRQIFGGIAQVIMTIMLSSFMQRLGYNTAIGGIHTAWLLWFGFVVAVFQMVPLLLVHDAVGALIAAAPMGILGSVAQAALVDLVIRSAPRGLQGTTMMLFYALYYVSVRFGDLFGTWIYDHHGGFIPTVVITIIVYAAILPVILLVPKRLTATKDAEAVG